MLGRKGVLLLGSQIRVGGAQKALLTLAGHLHDKGIPVTAAFFYDKDGLQAVWQAEADFPILVLEAWKENGGLANLRRIAGGFFRLNRLIHRMRPASMISYTEHANMPGMLAGWLGGVPLRIVTARGRIQGFKTWQGWLHAAMLNLGFGSCLVANSENGRAMSMREGVRSNKIEVIPNGIEVRQVDPQVRQRVRRELALQDNVPLVFSAGRMAYEKGHDLLIEAAAQVITDCPDVVFLAAGDGELRLKYETQISRLGLTSQVRFLGYRKDIPDLMAAADIYTLPSRSEGMPNALLEAMSLGLPAAAFKMGGVSEIITDGLTGLLATPKNPAALAGIITRLVMDKDLRQKLGSAGQEHVRREYDLQKMLNRYRELLLPEK
jgi:glycosyltransferase involved in cell wall biosynthesis